MSNAPASSSSFPEAITKDGYQQISGSCGVYELVHLYTGNFLSRVQVVDVSTIGEQLSFSLIYNSMDTVLGPVGHKWRHNYMKSLILSGSPVTYVSFVSQSGRHYGFVQDGSSWVLDTAGGTGFFPGTLTYTNPGWRITLPEGTYYVFDDSGALTQSVDRHGNATSLTYVDGLLACVTEPTGRQILFSYTNGLLTGVTDPRQNTTTLSYDTDSNLTVIVAPSGCTTTYGYAIPSNHLITSRRDARNSQYGFSHDSAGRLYQVTDPETPSHTLTYTYDLVSEKTGSMPVTYQDLHRTILTDARGQAWDYRFDLTANLRRIIDPLGHSRFFYWDQVVPDQGISHQKLLYENAGTPLWDETIFDPMQSSWRSAFDDAGDRIYETDANGSVTHYTHDAAHNITSSHPGQAHLGVQGNWVGQYGEDGYLLCAFQEDGSDLQGLPSYVSGVTTANMTRLHQGEDSSTFDRLLDPRTLNDATSLKRGVGAWVLTGTDPQISIALDEEKGFNLSFYACANFLEYFSGSTCMPLQYAEQFGFDMTITVEDLGGTQSFRVYNTAPGVWVTFPVKGDATHPISVTVVPNAPCEHAGVWAMTFDPYENPKTTYTYNTTNDLVSITDGLGNQTTMTYNTDGTLATVTDALSRQTRYFYEDAHRNCTRIVDACGNETRYSYDANGNVLTLTDPSLRVTTWTYDDRNRMRTVTDPLGHVTTHDYDNAGNLVAITDANGNVTEFGYTPSNQLASVTDALDHVTSFSHDGSGALIGVTDANGHGTTYAYDNAGRLVAITLPDGTSITYVHDGNDRVRAVTTPNGNQAPSAVNLVNAFNWLRNPGMEEVSPRDSSLPAGWIPGPANVRDTTVSHSGQASARLGAEYWSQANIPLPTGSSAFLRFWVRPDGEAHSSRAWPEVWYYDADRGLAPHRPQPDEIAGGSTDWLQTTPYAFTLPGEEVVPGCSVREVRLYGQTVGALDVDDATLHTVSTGYTYDREGRLQQVITPDGAMVVHRRDRLGRVVAIVDPRGKTVRQAYDSLGRLVTITDPLGNTTTCAYDAVGNRIRVTDPRGSITQYAYDDCNRLIRITYPDQTTELFSYGPAGSLQAYTNNRNQRQTFVHDGAGRRVLTHHEVDQTCVRDQHDAVGNRIRRVERNGDLLQYHHDAADRLIGVERLPLLPTGVAWIQAYQHDNVGNRIAFRSGASGPCFDAAVYDTAACAEPALVWSATLDACDRMVSCVDTLAGTFTFTHDVEGRCTGITYPGGSPAQSGSMGHDIVGRLMEMDAQVGTTNVLPLRYGYDAASNRIGSATGTDTLDHAVDDAGRLVQEDLNRFVERSMDRFSTGQATLCALDPSLGAITLLPLPDSLQSSSLHCDRWRMAYGGGASVGLEVRPMGSGLQFCFPKGYCNNVQAPSSPYGLSQGLVWAAAEHRQRLSGDFDVCVDFSDYQGKVDPTTGERYGALAAGLYVSTAPAEGLSSSTATQAFIARDNAPRYHAKAVTGGVPRLDASSAATSDTAGRFRICRKLGGKQDVLTLHYWNATTQDWTCLGTSTSFPAGDLYVGLYLGAQSSVGSVGYSDFRTLQAYAGLGTYTSSVYDACRSVTWGTLSCDVLVPGGTTFRMQVAVSNSPAGPWTYVGPDGTSASFFTTFPAALPTLVGRYFRYQATFAGNGQATPELTRVDVAFSGAVSSITRTHAYDAAGNMVLKVTSNPSGGPTMEVRDNDAWPSSDRINNLDQILRNDVTVGASFDSAVFDQATYDSQGTVTTSRYTYDASGNLTSRTDGANTWTYQWDDDDRLVQVGLPGGITLGYAYDSAGRMLTRTHSVEGTTTLEWDGWDCVREVAPGGTVTRWGVPQGQLLWFTRGGIRYNVYSDALGSVRMVTGSDGTVVARFDHDAWGNLLESSYDNVPGGMPYGFVGSLGVRWDAGTGLHYMRHRWYDPGLGRFVSRDPIGPAVGPNPYVYADDSPVAEIDEEGESPYGMGGSGNKRPEHKGKNRSEGRNAKRQGQNKKPKKDKGTKRCQDELPDRHFPHITRDPFASPIPNPTVTPVEPQPEPSKPEPELPQLPVPVLPLPMPVPIPAIPFPAPWPMPIPI